MKHSDNDDRARILATPEGQASVYAALHGLAAPDIVAAAKPLLDWRAAGDRVQANPASLAKKC